jgi:hypothetical protein
MDTHDFFKFFIIFDSLFLEFSHWLQREKQRNLNFYWKHKQKKYFFLYRLELKIFENRNCTTFIKKIWIKNDWKNYYLTNSTLFHIK